MTAANSSTLLFALGLFAALWLLAGLWATLRGIAMQRRSAFVAGQTERLASLVEASPYLPVIVRGDWRIEASERLGRWLGIERGPRNFDELSGIESGLDAVGHEALRQAILGAQRGAKPFTLQSGAAGRQPDDRHPRRRGAGGGRRARQRAVVVERCDRRAAGAGAGAQRARRSDGGVRRIVGADRGGALPDVASAAPASAGDGQRRLCPRGRGRRARSR